jgi:hypothetical protein
VPLEAQDVRIYLDVILQPELQKGISDIIFHERPLHRMKNGFDEAGGRFIGFQPNPVIQFLFETPEKTQVEALEYLTRVRWERDYLDMNGPIVHQKDSLLACEFFIGSQFLNVGDEND